MNHARAHALPLRLIDGGLVNILRDRTVNVLAADLVTYDAFRNKSDAVRCLLARGHRSLDVARYLDDARQVAAQTAVAREMANG